MLKSKRPRPKNKEKKRKERRRENTSDRKNNSREKEELVYRRRERGIGQEKGREHKGIRERLSKAKERYQAFSERVKRVVREEKIEGEIPRG